MIGDRGLGRAASQLYDVDVLHPSRLSRWARSAALLAWGALNAGGPFNPGGRRARIAERESGETVATVSEVLGDDVSEIDAVVADLDRLSAEDFRDRWAGVGKTCPA